MREMIVGMNLTKSHYKHIWKCQNETTLYNYYALTKIFLRKNIKSLLAYFKKPSKLTGYWIFYFGICFSNHVLYPFDEA
jgi:hypothetical protein